MFLAISVPLAGLIAGVALTRTATSTDRETIIAENANADIFITIAPYIPAATRDKIANELPEGSNQTIAHLGKSLLIVNSLSVPAAVSDLDLTSPHADGRLALVEGRGPANESEVAVSEAFAQTVSSGIPDTVQLFGREHRIVGIVVNPNDTTSPEVLFSSNARLSDQGIPETVLVSLPDGSAVSPIATALKALAEQRLAQSQLGPEFVVYSAQELADALPIDPQLPIARAVGGVFLLAGVLSAMSIYGDWLVNNRRTLGLLTLSGISPRQSTALIMMHGSSVCAFGIAGGIGFGWLLATLGASLVSELTNRIPSGPKLFATDIIIPTVAVATGLMLLLAITIVQIRTKPALHYIEHRPAFTVERRSRLEWIGPILSVVGLVWAILAGSVKPPIQGMVTAGSIVLALGAVSTIPGLIKAIRRGVGNRPDLALTLVIATRNAAKTGPAIAAASVVLAGCLTFASITMSNDRAEAADYIPKLDENHVLVQTSVAATVIESEVAKVWEAHAVPVLAAQTEAGGAVFIQGPIDPEMGGLASGPLIVATPELLSMLRGSSIPVAEIEGQMTDGLIVGLGSRPVRADGSVQIAITQENGEIARQSASAIAISAPTRTREARYLASANTIGQLGFTTSQEGVLIDLSSSPTDRQAVDIADIVNDVDPQAIVTVDRPPPSLRNWRLAALAFAITIAMTVLGALIVLNVIHAKPLRSLLKLQGASPRWLTGLSFGQGAATAFLAALVSVPLGLIPAASSLLRRGNGHQFLIPWSFLLSFLIIIPLAAGTMSVIAAKRR